MLEVNDTLPTYWVKTYIWVLKGNASTEVSANSGETLIYSIACKDKKILYKKQEYKRIFLWCSSAAWIDICYSIPSAYMFSWQQRHMHIFIVCIWTLVRKSKSHYTAIINSNKKKKAHTKLSNSGITHSAWHIWHKNKSKVGTWCEHFLTSRFFPAS